MDTESSLSIGELAKRSDKSVFAIRYYESEGLITDVRRNSSGHRRYSVEHVDWLRLLECLRSSGMSIAKMKDYAELVRRGDASLAERQRFLRAHLRDVGHKIDALERCAEIVRAKIDFYELRQRDPAARWVFPGSA